MYKNEAAFVHAIMDRLKVEGTDCVRLESHGTEVGIPDLFVQGYGHDCFVEFKNKHIIYRPGQEAWHKRYYAKHAKRKSVVTLCSRDDGSIVFASSFDNVIRPVKARNLSRFLFVASSRISYAETNRIALVHWVHKFWPVSLDWDPDIVECVHEQLDKPFNSKYMNDNKFDLFTEIENLIT